MPSIPRRRSLSRNAPIEISTTSYTAEALDVRESPELLSDLSASSFSSLARRSIDENSYDTNRSEQPKDDTKLLTSPLDLPLSPISFEATSDSIPDLLSPHAQQHDLLKRQQQTVAIPLTYKGLDAGPSPGTVVGIVLGSVAGAILLFWLIYFTIINAPNTGVIEGNETEIETEVIERHHRSHSSPHRRRKRRSRHHSSHHSEVSERPAPPPEPAPIPERRERILVSETRRTEKSRTRQPSVPPPATVSESREHESVFEETRERRVEGDDVVEVIEEHSEMSSEQPKRKSKRSSGFRTVDPNAYAGGDYPQRSVYDDGRRKSSGRR